MVKNIYKYLIVRFIFSAGVVIDQPPSGLTVIVNRTGFLFCSATNHGGNLDVMYEWHFNGHPLNIQHNPHVILVSLFFNNLTHSVS